MVARTFGGRHGGKAWLTPDGEAAVGHSIPLYLPRHDFHKAMALLGDAFLFRVAVLRQPRVGILVTGTEVFMGLVEDKFIPIQHQN